MELVELIELLQARYVSLFEAVYEEQLLQHDELFAEIAFELSGTVYKNLYVVDLISRDGENNGAIEVAAPENSYLGNLSAVHDRLKIEIGSVSWEAIEFVADPMPETLVGFEAWFDNWIDLEGLRVNPDEVFSGVIHSATIADGSVAIDFGTAPAQSFFELLTVFSNSGVESLRVQSARKQ